MYVGLKLEILFSVKSNLRICGCSMIEKTVLILRKIPSIF